MPISQTSTVSRLTPQRWPLPHASSIRRVSGRESMQKPIDASAATTVLPTGTNAEARAGPVGRAPCSLRPEPEIGDPGRELQRRRLSAERFGSMESSSGPERQTQSERCCPLSKASASQANRDGSHAARDPRGAQPTLQERCESNIPACKSHASTSA